MAAENNGGADFWGTNLINPDKSASPLLDQLCLGIARLIATLEPLTTDLLIPPKIASFYRLVGGNYDSLFLSTPNPGISLVYRSLGCFHSLQPLPSPFETPCVPALLPTGLVRWLTVQLLLDPNEHVPYLQEALRRFEIVNPTTGTSFPKILPRQAFAEQPDKAMTKWHEEVSKRLEQDHQHVKFRRSPHLSPRGEIDRREYLGNGSTQRRPSRSSRNNSREQVLPALDARRRSLPDQNLGFPPQPSPEDVRYMPGYPAVIPRQIRNTSSSRHRDSSSSTRRQSSSTRSRPGSSAGARPDQPPFGSYPPQPTQPRHHHRKRSSTVSSPVTPRQQPQSPKKATDGHSSSGSDASSETSSPNQTAGNKGSGLFPPTAYFRHHQRRHSHDPSYKHGEPAGEMKPPLPPRPINIPKKNVPNPVAPSPNFKTPNFNPPTVNPPNVNPPIINPPTINAQNVNYVQGSTLRHRDPFRHGSMPAGKFNERIFESDARNGGNGSAPASPSNTTAAPTNRFRHVDPKGRGNGTAHPKSMPQGTSNIPSNGSMSGGEQPTVGVPSRHPTVSGVRGRRYVPPEAQKNNPQPVAVGGNNANASGIPQLFSWD